MLAELPTSHPRYQEKHPDIQIDTDTFLQYLVPITAEVPADLIANDLDLSPLTPLIKDVYDLRVEVDEFDPQQRHRLESGADLSHFEAPLNRRHIQTVYERNAELSNRRSLAEVQRVIYYDSGLQGVTGSPLSAGQVRTVAYDTTGMIEAGKYPLIIEHSHADAEALFSPKDYLPVLLKGYASGQRLAKALLLLWPATNVNPPCQFLGVATAETLPPMDHEVLETYINSWDERFHQELAHVDKPHEAIYHELRDMRVRRLSREMVSLEEFVTRRNGHITPDEQRFVLAEKDRLSAINTAGLNLFDSQEYLAAEAAYFSALDRVNADLHRQLALAVGLKLYRSTNMADWYAYSLD